MTRGKGLGRGSKYVVVVKWPEGLGSNMYVLG